MREGVSKPTDGVDEFSPTVAPTSRPEPSRVTEAATGVPQRPDEAGDTLLGAVLADRYRIDRRVGAGGMGAVYVGTHLALNKTIAVKVIQPRLGADATIAQRFIQEARAASAIGHEHIVQITDFGTTAEGGSFLVMEYLDGEDLAETLRREGPLPWQRVVHLGEQIAWALAAAHKNGIVHRDIKPANCYRVPREHDPDFIKVLDFGLAKVTVEDRQGGESLTHTGMLLGTPGYIAPELYRGLKADHRVDIYALGALMYKLLTGELPPMTGSEAGEPMCGLPAPDAVATVLGKALRENPEQRWSAAHELAAALRAIPRPAASDEPTILQPLAASPPRPTSGPLHRPEAASVPGLSIREPTPASFSSLVTVERDGQRVRLSLGIPALIMLVALVGGLVFVLTRSSQQGAPVAEDMSPGPALPVAAPPTAPTPPTVGPATTPPDPIKPTLPVAWPTLPVAGPTLPDPIPPPFAETTPTTPTTPPVAEPAPTTPPVATAKPPPRGTNSKLAALVTYKCLQDSDWSFRVHVTWKTDASGLLLPRTAAMPDDQPQPISPQIRECVLAKLKTARFTWDPERAYDEKLAIGKPPTD